MLGFIDQSVPSTQVPRGQLIQSLLRSARGKRWSWHLARALPVIMEMFLRTKFGSPGYVVNERDDLNKVSHQNGSFLSTAEETPTIAITKGWPTHTGTQGITWECTGQAFGCLLFRKEKVVWSESDTQCAWSMWTSLCCLLTLGALHL